MKADETDRVEKLLGDGYPAFVAVTPPDDLAAPIGASSELMAAICADGQVSFELHGEGGQVRYGLRGRDVGSVRRQLDSHFSQAQLSIPSRDPMKVRHDETVHTAVLKVMGPEQMPLKTFSDEQICKEGTDPLLGIVAELGGLPEGVRILVRALVSPKPSNWAQRYKRDAQSGAGGSNVETKGQEQQQQQEQQRQAQTSGGDPTAVLVIVTIMLALSCFFAWVRFPDQFEWTVAFLRGINFYEAIAVFVIAAVPVALLIFGVYFLVSKIRSLLAPEVTYHDPDLVKKRIYGSAYHLEIQIIVFTRNPGVEATASRQREFVQSLSGQYRRFNTSEGSSFVLHDEFPGLPRAPLGFNFRKRRLWFGRERVGSMVGLWELAGLWHLPSAANNPHQVSKTRLKRLPLGPGLLNSGSPIGVTTAGERRLVRLDEEALGKHMFLAAGTGMGKSTAITHVLRDLMLRKAAGTDDTGIVVIDPHSLLVEELLSHVPPEIAHRVRLIDLANTTHTPGINLLSPQISPSRDSAAECMAKIAEAQWDHWGSRMDEILRYSVRTLHSANSHPSVAPENAFTLLDITTLLRNRNFRQEVLSLVDDYAIPRWWDGNFRTLAAGDQSLTLGPITNRLSEYEGSGTARLIFGQSFSTFDLRESIEAGDIVFVDTASGQLDDKVSNLVGAYVLMMVDEIVRSRKENSTEHPHTIVVVDEMQELAGVGFDKMLSEWRKYRASLVLITQTLGKLRSASDSLVESILTNAGLLAVFNVSAAPAQDLAPNLGLRMIGWEEVISLPPFHAYVRLKLTGKESTTFSMRLLPPVDGSPAMRDEIHRRSVRYAQNSEVVWHRLQRKYRDDLGLEY